MVKDGYRIQDKNAYKHRVVGRDYVKVLVNKANLVGKLTKEQLKGICPGKLVNWKEVGGKDETITIARTRSGSFIWTQTIEYNFPK